MNKSVLCYGVAIGLLSACVTSQQKQPYEPKVAISVKNSVPPILEYARQFNGLSADLQKKELMQIQQKITLNDSDQNARVTLALLYSLPDNKHRDTTKSVVLFDKALQDKSLDHEVATMSMLFREIIADHNKLYADSNKLGEKLKDAQQQSEILTKKLEELKNIEKTLGAREPSAGK